MIEQESDLLDSGGHNADSCEEDTSYHLPSVYSWDGYTEADIFGVGETREKGKCSCCGHSFCLDFLPRHRVLCIREHEKKRRMRIMREMELATNVDRLRHLATVRERQGRIRNWRQHHEEFVHAISLLKRAAPDKRPVPTIHSKLPSSSISSARSVTVPLKPSPSASSYSRQSSNGDLKLCEHCGRRFNTSAFVKHEPRCKEEALRRQRELNAMENRLKVLKEAAELSIRSKSPAASSTAMSTGRTPQSSPKPSILMRPSSNKTPTPISTGIASPKKNISLKYPVKTQKTSLVTSTATRLAPQSSAPPKLANTNTSSTESLNIKETTRKLQRQDNSTMPLTTAARRESSMVAAKIASAKRESTNQSLKGAPRDKTDVRPTEMTLPRSSPRLCISKPTQVIVHHCASPVNKDDEEPRTVSRSIQNSRSANRVSRQAFEELADGDACRRQTTPPADIPLISLADLPHPPFDKFVDATSTLNDLEMPSLSSFGEEDSHLDNLPPPVDLLFEEPSSFIYSGAPKWENRATFPTLQWANGSNNDIEHTKEPTAVIGVSRTSVQSSVSNVSNFCYECGGMYQDVSDRFCGQCGTPRYLNTA